MGTCGFLHDIGSRIAEQKCNFTTHAALRPWLARKQWLPWFGLIPLVTSFRDLGATLDTTCRADTKLSRHRLGVGVAAVRKISFLPEDLVSKAMYVRSVALGGGIYACEVSNVDEAALRDLASVIAKMLQPSCYQPCQALVFALACVGEDLDPSIHILYKRLLMLRRTLIRYPQFKDDVIFLLHHYHRRQHVGTL